MDGGREEQSNGRQSLSSCRLGMMFPSTSTDLLYQDSTQRKWSPPAMNQPEPLKVFLQHRIRSVIAKEWWDFVVNVNNMNSDHASLLYSVANLCPSFQHFLKSRDKEINYILKKRPVINPRIFSGSERTDVISEPPVPPREHPPPKKSCSAELEKILNELYPNEKSFIKRKPRLSGPASKQRKTPAKKFQSAYNTKNSTRDITDNNVTLASLLREDHSSVTALSAHKPATHKMYGPHKNAVSSNKKVEYAVSDFDVNRNKVTNKMKIKKIIKVKKKRYFLTDKFSPIRCYLEDETPELKLELIKRYKLKKCSVKVKKLTNKQIKEAMKPKVKSMPVICEASEVSEKSGVTVTIKSEPVTQISNHIEPSQNQAKNEPSTASSCINLIATPREPVISKPIINSFVMPSCSIVAKVENSSVPAKVEDNSVISKVEGSSLVAKVERIPVHDNAQSVPILDNAQEVPVVDKAQGVPVGDKVQGVPVVDKVHTVPVVDKVHSVPILESVTIVAKIEDSSDVTKVNSEKSVSESITSNSQILSSTSEKGPENSNTSSCLKYRSNQKENVDIMEKFKPKELINKDLKTYYHGGIVPLGKKMVTPDKTRHFLSLKEKKIKESSLDVNDSVSPLKEKNVQNVTSEPKPEVLPAVVKCTEKDNESSKDMKGSEQSPEENDIEAEEEPVVENCDYNKADEVEHPFDKAETNDAGSEDEVEDEGELVIDESKETDDKGSDDVTVTKCAVNTEEDTENPNPLDEPESSDCGSQEIIVINDRPDLLESQEIIKNRTDLIPKIKIETIECDDPIISNSNSSSLVNDVGSKCSDENISLTKNVVIRTYGSEKEYVKDVEEPLAKRPRMEVNLAEMKIDIKASPEVASLKDDLNCRVCSETFNSVPDWLNHFDKDVPKCAPNLQVAWDDRPELSLLN